MTNRLATRFYAIDHEDGPQFYMLVQHPTFVTCYLLPDVKTDAEIWDGPRFTTSAYDAATVMWAGRRLDDGQGR